MRWFSLQHPVDNWQFVCRSKEAWLTLTDSWFPEIRS